MAYRTIHYTRKIWELGQFGKTAHLTVRVVAGNSVIASSLDIQSNNVESERDIFYSKYNDK